MEQATNSADVRTASGEWQAAIDYGIDVTLLEHNLKLTPTERLEQLHQMTLEDLIRVKEHLGRGKDQQVLRELRALRERTR